MSSLSRHCLQNQSPNLMRKLLLLLLLLGVLQKATAQTALYVDSSMTTSGAGTTWATAYKTLNEALNVANGGSASVSYNIHIAKGTYYTESNPRDSAFGLLRNGLRVYGGSPSCCGIRLGASYHSLLSADI